MSDPLRSLYPFLHDTPQDAAALQAGLLESVRRKADDSAAAKRAFFDAHAGQVVDMARSLAQVYRRGGRLFTAGNGGSSCDAAHIAVEFLHPVTTGRPALAATNLAGDIAMLTAVSD